MGKIVAIPEAKYKKLLRDQLELQLLESAGVDNWQWYGSHWDELMEMEIDGIEDWDIDSKINHIIDEKIRRRK